MTDKPESHTDDERPATYREVFTAPEIGALFGSFALSKASSMLARVAITFLVFQNTQSAFLATAAFAITYAPYLGPAQLLAALADRLPYRSTMVASDLIRMVLIGLVALPGMPLPVMLALVFMSAMVEPAYQASRSALLPKLVTGDALTLALSVYLTLNQSAQLVGYFLGGVIAAVDPHLALVINAMTFGVSGLILLTFVRHRPPDSDASQRKNLFRETAEGFALVFGDKVLRIIALVVFATVIFTIIPEGAAAPWAKELNGGAVLQGAIMACAPAAAIVSSIVFTRFTPPPLRQKLIRPLVLLAPLSLVPALLNPSWPVVIAIAVLCNLTLASLAPLNAIFVKAVPEGYRARAFSVMQSGLSLLQGLAVVSMGLMSEIMSVPRAVGLWGVAGVVVVLILLILWPSGSEFDDAVARNAPADKEKSAS